MAETTLDTAIRLLDLRDTPLSVDEVLAAVRDAGSGGTAVFVGTVRDDDSVDSTEAVVLSHDESYEAGRHKFVGELKLESTGPFGYTVRVLPRHDLLVRPAELGLVAWPERPEPEHR